jgi:predicted HTH transcriptional regulator
VKHGSIRRGPSNKPTKADRTYPQGKFPVAKQEESKGTFPDHRTRIGHVEFYQWIEEGEHERQDFKETISSSRKIARALCAFANTRGGRLLVGVRDNGSLRHLDTEAEKQMLENAGSFFCKPQLHLEFYPLQVGMKELLVVEVHESLDKPVRCLSEDGEWEVYIRSKDQCLLASDMSIRMLRNEDPQEEGSTVLEFGSKEQALLDYLRTHPRINVPQCRAMFNIGKTRARNMLIQLTRTGLLTLHSHEKEDYFTLGPGDNAGSGNDHFVQSRP